VTRCYGNEKVISAAATYDRLVLSGRASSLTNYDKAHIILQLEFQLHCLFV
jgi:hypothetical protein